MQFNDKLCGFVINWFKIINCIEKSVLKMWWIKALDEFYRFTLLSGERLSTSLNGTAIDWRCCLIALP